MSTVKVASLALRFLLELAVLAVAVVALVAADAALLGLILAVVAVLNGLLLHAWGLSGRGATSRVALSPRRPTDRAAAAARPHRRADVPSAGRQRLWLPVRP